MPERPFPEHEPIGSDLGVRRAAGVRLRTSGFWKFKLYRVSVARGPDFTYTRGAFQRLVDEVEAGRPVIVGMERRHNLWWAKQGFFWADADLTAETVAARIANADPML